MKIKHIIALCLVLALVMPSTALAASSLPSPNFVASKTSGHAPLKVTFTYTGGSKTGVTSHKWSYGDGTSCVSCWHPSHVYTKPGIYTVSLTMKNAAGSRTKTIKNYIRVY